MRGIKRQRLSPTCPATDQTGMLIGESRSRVSSDDERNIHSTALLLGRENQMFPGGFYELAA
ncbi:MAG: hypothetical protein U5K79_07765 [Cyclobacteriaceae bacterium]|nr:hypothetical protein [Cyclobacteriaceae bacterium]